jgi:hypothetical protein
MPQIDFTDEERRALADVAREYVRTQRYPLAPLLAPNDEIPPPPGGSGLGRRFASDSFR